MTDSRYDPHDIKTWPKAAVDAHVRAQQGLVDGDLQPLADYIRAGHYMHPNLTVMIADAIEGRDFPYHIKIVGRKKGQRRHAELAAIENRKMQIGVFMEDRIRANGRGGYESALEETREHFSVSKRTATEHHSYAKRFIGDAPTPALDLFPYYRRMYLEGRHPFENSLAE